MKNFLFYTLLAAMFALPVVASATDKVDCTKKENAANEACKHHEGDKH